MKTQLRRATPVALVALALALVPRAAYAQSAQVQYYEAYYKETVADDQKGAADLYAKVLDNPDASPGLKSDAKERLAGIREEIAAEDLARFLPPNAVAFFEVNRPGQAAIQLLGQLGMLRDKQQAVDTTSRRFAISPDLIREILGIRSLAVGITGFDPSSQTPRGVVILNPGKLQIIRAVLETGLPIGGEAVESIAGFETYRTPGNVFVTLTTRLVIISQQRQEIEDAVNRMIDPDADSLANTGTLAGENTRRRNATLFFLVDAKPLMPLMQPALAAASSREPKVALGTALLDPRSLDALTGYFTVNEAGVDGQLTVRMRQGHKSIVFNWLRLPALERETLASIPAGAAFFFAKGLNPTTASSNTGTSEGDGAQIVTMMDYGRELFGNLRSIAVFGLVADTPGDKGPPRIGAILRVNDTAHSDALWNQVLGLASIASGRGGTLDGSSVKIGGVSATAFRMGGGVTIYKAIVDDLLVVASDDSTLAEVLDARQSGRSVLDDDAYSPALHDLESSTTSMACVQPARCMAMAEGGLHGPDADELRGLAEAMQRTVAVMKFAQSDTSLLLSLRVTGLPDLGPFVAEQIARNKAQDSARQAAASRANQLEREFRQMHASDPARAEDAGLKLLALHGNNARWLNNFAWRLLTEDEYGRRFDDLALKMAKRANELTDHENWAYLDTLAVAQHRAGDKQAAIDTEREALKRARGTAGEGEVRERLQRYESETQ